MSEPVINPGFNFHQFHAETWGEDYIKYRRNWSKYPKEYKTSEWPLHLDIEVTNRCNLTCPFCPRTVAYERGDPYPEGDMKLETWHQMLNGVQFKVASMKFNWRGEPLMCELLPIYILEAKLSGIIETAINTNGTLLDEKMACRLIEAGLDRVIFSIDSIDPRIYREQRRGAELDHVLSNISGLIRLKKELELERPYIRVQKIDLPETRGENFIGFWEEFGVDACAINSYKEKDYEKVEWEPLQCAQPFQRLIVAWNGEFYPCCQGHNFKPLGALPSMTVHQAWHSPTMDWLRDLHKANRQGEISQCRRCETTKP